MQALARWIQRDMAMANLLSLPAHMPSPIRRVSGAAKLWLSLRPQCHRQPGDANRCNNASARARTVRGRSLCSHTVPLRGSHRLHGSIRRFPYSSPQRSQLPNIHIMFPQEISLGTVWELMGNYLELPNQAVETTGTSQGNEVGDVPLTVTNFVPIGLSPEFFGQHGGSSVP